MQDEDGEETGEDVTRDDSWNYADILWNGIRADAVRAAFEKLDYMEQDFLEMRNAICMTCGRVDSWEERASFEKMATDYEYSTTGGAEKAYKKAVDKLTRLLVDADVLGVVELKLIEKHKKILGVIYEYKAVHRFSNEDDCAGQIKISFREMDGEILSLADGDFCKTNVFAEVAIRRILQIPFRELPKKLTIPFELVLERIRYGG